MSTETATSSSTMEYKTKVVWFNAIGFLVMHLLAFYGLWLAYASARFATFLWAAALVILARESMTIGAHRLFSHRSFKATWPTRLLIVMLQTIAGENCLYIWVRDHRQHHKYFNTEADPYNAHHRLFLPYNGWPMVQKHPEVIAKRKTIDMSDLEADSLVMLQKRYYEPLYVVLAVLVPIGVPMIFWNENLLNSVMVAFFLRHVALLNILRLHSSAAHMYDTRHNDKDLVTTQNAAASFISSGEGWHNFHYAFPWDYRAEEYGQNFNISTAVINFMERLAMVSDLKVASPKKTRVMKNDDGSRPICNEIYNEKSMEHTEGSAGETTDQNVEDNSLERKQTATQHSLNEQKLEAPFTKSSNNPIINSQTQQKSVMEDAVLQKIFSDLGIDEDIANERNFVSSSLLKGNTSLNNRHHLVHTTRTESVRHG